MRQMRAQQFRLERAKQSRKTTHQENNTSNNLHDVRYTDRNTRHEKDVGANIHAYNSTSASETQLQRNSIQVKLGKISKFNRKEIS